MHFSQCKCLSSPPVLNSCPHSQVPTESFEDMLRWLPDNPDSGLSVDEDSVVVTKGKTWQMVLGHD
uniref:Uncharacterized protein n=2 Tax=Rhinopithecus TaxID=542827 RepID=A0A2K6JX17_RHIBE